MFIFNYLVLQNRKIILEATKQIVTETETKIYAVPLTTTESQPNLIDKESTLDDYNNVPINDFGMAMLRGMGWTESSSIGKNTKQ